MTQNTQNERWARIKAGWRDTWILLRQFRQPLLLFFLMLIGVGILYYLLSQTTDNPASTLIEAIFDVLTLAFLQPVEPFPDEWYLQIMYFILPIAGMALLAIGLADFGIMFFNRKIHGKDWQLAVAATFSNHIVLVGLGHLGYRVVLQLHEIGRDIVVIEQSSKPHLTGHLQELGIPVIEDDATRPDILMGAGIQNAHTIILCTQNDSLNLEIALKARNLQSQIDVVIRIFDNEFAESLQKQFGFRALSATGMAAPLFAAAASNADITPPIYIEGQPHILARLEVSPQSRLNGLTVNQVEETYHASLVYLNQNGASFFHPEGGITILPGASLALFGEPSSINQLLNEKER